MKDPNKEKVDEAIETLVSHYGRGICKWLVKKFPKTTKAIATTVIFLVGGFMLYFVVGISGEDPIDFVFDNIGKEVFTDKTTNVETNSAYEGDDWHCPVGPAPTNEVNDVAVVTEDPTGKVVTDTNGNSTVWVKEEKK